MSHGIWSDFAYAARSLAKARAYTTVCVLSLGIGMVPVIGVPYAARIPHMPPLGVNTHGLVEVVTPANQERPPGNSWSYADFMDLANADTGIKLIGWSTAPSVIALPDGQKMPLWPMYVSAGYFETLGVRLHRGPGFGGPAEAELILGYRFWQNHLSADPAIVGKTIKLENVPFVVAGIAPDQFQGHLGLQGRDMFVPLERYPLLAQDGNARFDRGKEWLHIHGRLSQGVSIAQANAAVAGLTSQLAKAYPAANRLKSGMVVEYDPLGYLDRSQFRIMEALALALTGAVLLVVCLNTSGMMQVRSAMRERELSIRQAIGASRRRLARHLLAEAVLLAAAGGALASLALFNFPKIVSLLIGQPLPAAFQDALKVDASMIAICIGLCLVTSLIFGFLPAIRFSRPVMISALKDNAGAGGFRAGRVHRITAALQIALAAPLLVLGAISLDRVRSTATSDLGFQADSLYAAPLDFDAVPGARLAGSADFKMESLRDQLAKASGVASVTVADGMPLDFRGRGATVSLGAEEDEPATPVRVHVTRVGENYLHTMGIPLLTGVDFTRDHGAAAERVTIISNALAGRLFPNGGAAEAIGKRLTLAAGERKEAAAKPPQTLTILGVTADFPTSQMSTDRAQILLPLAQQEDFRRYALPVDAIDGGMPAVLLIARSEPGEQPQKILAAVENVVRELNPEFRRERIVTGAFLRKNSMNDFLKASAVAGVASSVMLMLSALGIYGVVGLMVAARTREIAVRIALGASRRRVMGMILSDVVKLTAPGVAVGLIFTAALIRLGGDRFGVPLSSVETLAYAVGAAIAIGVAVLASLVPARRAASVLPMVAMRSE